ncbi:hypothetical protein [Desulfatiglans anilini]|uniref:hypothetical protein n=1 Tax=Desulfatiglans anilini TaxID=90728 RepID=UPI00129484EF|nr:hypothetical protein [Desulfatiglans anilini]
MVLLRFRLEMVFLSNLWVNLRACLCGGLQVASAQLLDFLDLGQKPSFPAGKLFRFQSFISGWTLVRMLSSGNGLFVSSGRQSARLLVRRPAGRLRASAWFFLILAKNLISGLETGFYREIIPEWKLN